jgi:hypothetical protein
MQDITLIRNSRRDANAERGARFHPTVGSVTPNRFTTSHPRARPRCLRFNFLLPAQRKTRTKVTLLLLCSELPVFPEFLQFFPAIPVARVLSLLPPLTTLPLLPFLCKIACGVNFPIRGQVWELLRMGGSPPSPH